MESFFVATLLYSYDDAWHNSGRTAYSILSFDVIANITASTVDDCKSLIDPQATTIAFYPATLRCISYRVLKGFNTNNIDNVFYIKLIGKCSQCASVQDTLKVILNYAYETEACPTPANIFNFDINTGYCVGNMNDQIRNVASKYFSNYGAYTQGIYTNYTLLVMSRGLASRALKVSCPFENSTTGQFNNIWYCYTPFLTPTPSASYITNNICVDWVPGGGTLVNFVHSAEPGLLAMKNGPVSYIGYLAPGYPPSPYNYLFANGSKIVPTSHLTWATGAPLGRNLVYLSIAIQLLDYDASRMTRLMCRSQAPNPP